MECLSPSMKMDVFKFESFQMVNDDDQTAADADAGLASHLYSWDPFESKPFSRNALNNDDECLSVRKCLPICERIRRAEGAICNSTDSLLKMANSFKGQSILDLFDLSRKEEMAPTVHKLPGGFKSLAERRLKFQQNELRCWSFDVHQLEHKKLLSRDERIVGRKPQTATSTPTTNGTYSFGGGGYAMAVKKSLPSDASADSGLNISIEHSLSKLHQQQHNFLPKILMRAANVSSGEQQQQQQLEDDGFYECPSHRFANKEMQQFKNVDAPPSAFRCRSKSIRKRQFVNGIHLKFIKPASQCPDWDKPNHRGEQPGCTLWHPKAPCYFYPNCRLTADLCGFAHPFCEKNGCKCAHGKQSPQLNHLLLRK